MGAEILRIFAAFIRRQIRSTSALLIPLGIES